MPHRGTLDSFAAVRYKLRERTPHSGKTSGGTNMVRLIKRYESRKLYDTEESRYVSLEDISAWVRDGQQVMLEEEVAA